LIPDSLGARLFGSTWTLAAPLLLATTVQRWSGAFAIIPTIDLRVSGRVLSVAKTRSWITIASGLATLFFALLTRSAEVVAWTTAAFGILMSGFLLLTWYRQRGTVPVTIPASCGPELPRPS